jgi:rubrerythrin
MPTTRFNADELFSIAVQIEKNGAAFYRTAANNNASGRDLLLDLAAMEDRHEALFEQMRATVLEASSNGPAFDPEGEAAAYLSTIASIHVFDKRKEPRDLLKGSESLEEILRIAIGLEKDSIVYYVGFKDLVLAQPDRGQLDEIIREEMRHIILLNKERSKLQEGGPRE